MKRLNIYVDRGNRDRVAQDIATKFPHLSLIYDLRVRCEEDRKKQSCFSSFFEWIEELGSIFIKSFSTALYRLRKRKDLEDWQIGVRRASSNTSTRGEYIA